MRLNLKTLQLKLAVLPYKLLGSAVLQQFLQVPCSWLPDYSSVCGCWLLVADCSLRNWDYLAGGKISFLASYQIYVTELFFFPP